MHETTRTKVFIVDDHPQVRQSLRKLLEYEDDLQVCGEAADVSQAVFGILESQPDVAIVDLELGRQTGLDVIKQLHRRAHNLPILILSMHPESMYAESALFHGAQGYVMKSTNPDEIPFALRKVLAGEIYISTAMKLKLQSKGVLRYE